MQAFEYKVVAAPVRGEKVRGLKTTGDRFAHALSHVMNDLARDGWEYLRADTLPCEERHGLSGRTTTFQNMLVFRRAIAASEQRDAPRAADPKHRIASFLTARPPEGTAPAIAAPSREPAPQADTDAEPKPGNGMAAE